MENFVAWVSRDEYTPTGEVFDMGRTCLTAIRNYLKTDGKPALECGLDEDFSNGNGSLMRIHPVAFYLYHKGYEISEALEIIHKVSSITHAHERSKVACGIYTLVLWELLKNPNKLSVYEGLKKVSDFYASSSEFEIYKNRLIDRIGNLETMSSNKAVERNEIRSTGYVVDTLEAAIWCVLTTKDYKECVLRAVNLGEDTDTVAAVAGGLAGVLYGYDAIPREWLGQIKKLDYIENMCEQAEKSWMLPDRK
jgi:ADP-ribosylglycohydrolase